MMIRPSLTAFWTLAMMAVAATQLPAQDSVEDRLRKGHEVPLRWENIEGHPEWVSGEEPARLPWKRLHEITLDPGEKTCVRIPAYEWLRIFKGGRAIAKDEVEIALSTGSGLLAFTEPIVDRNGHSLLVDPRRPHIMLAHVIRPADADGPIRISLFASRHVPIPEMGSYRELIDLGAEKKARLSTSVEADVLAFWRWDRGDRAELRLRGPGRFLVETRYRYPKSEKKLPQTYHLDVREADRDRPLATVEYATSHETAHLVFAAGEAQVVSRLEPGFFELDEDREYRLALVTSAPVFVRVLRMEDPDYMIPALNAPDPRPAEVAEELRATRFQGSPWELSQARMVGTLKDPLTHPAEQIERTAMRLARDNRRSEGGMMASALLWNAGAPRRDYPDIRERWREFTGFRTYYRDALPEGRCLTHLQRCYFPARTLQPAGQFRDWIVLGEQHLDAGLGRLPLATFSPLQNGGGRSIYRLPVRSTQTLVRIAAVRDRDEPATFWLRISGQPTRRFTLLPQPEVPRRDTRPTQGEAALRLIGASTLDGQTSLRRDPAPTVAAGVFEFPVAPDVRRIELWNEAGGESLPVAMQYRASDVFELSEDEYASMVALSGSTDPEFAWLVEFLTGKGICEPGTPRAKRELFNHWEPLRRFVRSRYRQFADSVAPPGRLGSEVDWFEELEILTRDGVHFLATRLARYLYLHAKDATTRKTASARLSELAGRELDDETQILNACTSLIAAPDRFAVARLGQLLRRADEPELALMLAQALPEGEAATRELRLATAFVRGWWVHFDAVLEEGPDSPLCLLWRGHRHWREGRRSEALDSWEKAGAVGRPWLAHADATGGAVDLLKQGSPQGLSRWAQAEANAPGLRLWKPVAPEHVRSFHAGVSVRALEREKYFPAFVATPERPLELEFASPRRIRVECRPLHRVWSEDPLEGWIAIERKGGTSRKLPVITNYRSPGLEIVGRENLQPGTLVSDEFGVTDWGAQIRIRPDFGPMLVRVLSEDPEIRSGHLPPFGYKTAAWLFDREETALAQPLLEIGHGESEFGGVVAVGADHQVTRKHLGAPYANPSEEAEGTLHHALAGLAPVPLPMPRQDERDGIDRMIRRLWQRNHGTEPEIRQAIAGASADQHAQTDVPEIGRIYAALVRQTVWEPLLAADESAGFREIESPGWQPENPDLLTRMRLLKGLEPREQLISGTDSAVAVLTNRAENAVTARLSLATLPFLETKPLHARFQIGGNSAKEVVLTGERSEETFRFDVPVGRTTLRTDILRSGPNHYLKVAIDAEKDRDLLDRKTRRNYFVANADEPLSIRIDGPAWTRIDQLEGEGTISHYREIKAGVETLTLTPNSGQAQALYRIHVLRVDPDKPFHPPAFADRAVETVRPPLADQPYRERPDSVAYDDDFALGGQEDGTWTLGLSYHSRRAVEEDSVGSGDPERFWQGDLIYRYYHEDWRTWFRTTLLGRDREFGDNTWGLEHSLLHQPFDHPLNYGLTGKVFAQDGEWSLQGIGSISMTQELAPKWKHTPFVSVFFRALSLSDSGAEPERIDQDIFTPFKYDHQRGLRIGDDITYSPWRDTLLSAGASIGTNEDFNPINPDSFRYSAGIHQLLGPIQLGVEMRGHRFFADDDRDESVWRHRVHLEATGELWLPNQDRLEVGASLTHFVEESENGFFLFGRWHFGEGRMYRDFRPGETPFRGTREREIPQKRNNRVK